MVGDVRGALEGVRDVLERQREDALSVAGAIDLATERQTVALVRELREQKKVLDKLLAEQRGLKKAAAR